MRGSVKPDFLSHNAVPESGFQSGSSLQAGIPVRAAVRKRRQTMKNGRADRNSWGSPVKTGHLDRRRTKSTKSVRKFAFLIFRRIWTSPQDLAPFQLHWWLPRHPRACPSAGLDEWDESTQARRGCQRRPAAVPVRQTVHPRPLEASNVRWLQADVLMLIFHQTNENRPGYAVAAF